MNYEEGHTSHCRAQVAGTSDLAASPDAINSQGKHPLLNAYHTSKACIRGHAISSNPSSPRLVQSQEKHCARMVMNRTKQSPDLERQQQQKLIMQRMLASKQKQHVTQPHHLHIGSSFKLQQHDSVFNHGIPAPSGTQHPKGTGGSHQQPSHENVQLHRHSQPQSQFLENQSPHGRGSYTLRHIVEPKSRPRCPSKFERIFEILEVLQVLCQFCHVMHSSLACGYNWCNSLFTWVRDLLPRYTIQPLEFVVHYEC